MPCQGLPLLLLSQHLSWRCTRSVRGSLSTANLVWSMPTPKACRVALMAALRMPVKDGVLDLPGGDLGPFEPQELPLSGSPDSAIAPELPCDLCGKADREDVMLVCDNCSHGSHIDCLDPPLPEVPVGDWVCEPCKIEASTGKDITQDLATVDFLRTGSMPAVASKTEKARIRTRASRFCITESQLCHKESGKPTCGRQAWSCQRLPYFLVTTVSPRQHTWYRTTFGGEG